MDLLVNMYKCPRCGYQTQYLYNMNSHFERKNPCKPKISDIPFHTLSSIQF